MASRDAIPEDHAYDVFAENVSLRNTLSFFLMLSLIHAGVSLALVIIVVSLLKDLI